MKDLWITEIWRHGKEGDDGWRRFSREKAEELFGYNESVGKECPLVWKVDRARIRVGDALSWQKRGDGYGKTTFWYDSNFHPVRELKRSVFVQGLGAFINWDYDYLADMGGGGRVVDHIDGDKLNNVASNLRVVTRSQNGRNRRKQKGSSSIYRYVRYKGSRNPRSRWEASVRLYDNRRYVAGNKELKAVQVGSYSEEKEAAVAADDFLVKEYGLEGIVEECVRLNFPERYGISVDEGGGMDIKEGWEIPEPPQMGLF